MHSIILPPAVNSREDWLFNLGMETGLGKGKLNTNQLLTRRRIGSVRLLLPKICYLSSHSTTKSGNGTSDH